MVVEMAVVEEGVVVDGDVDGGAVIDIDGSDDIFVFGWVVVEMGFPV